MFNIQQLCQQLPNGALMIGFIVYTAWEWFLGRTVFGSTVGLVLVHPTIAFMRWMNNKKQPTIIVPPPPEIK